MTINNISPLRYPGGETSACKKIDHILREHFDLNNFDSIVSSLLEEVVLNSSFNFAIMSRYMPSCNHVFYDKLFFL